MGIFSSGFGIVLAIFIFVLAILWFLLPFAIFGTKDKLELLIAESKKTNTELARITAELSAARAELEKRRSSQDVAGNF